eukprot:326345_1
MLQIKENCSECGKPFTPRKSVNSKCASLCHFCREILFQKTHHRRKKEAISLVNNMGVDMGAKEKIKLGRKIRTQRKLDAIPSECQRCQSQITKCIRYSIKGLWYCQKCYITIKRAEAGTRNELWDCICSEIKNNKLTFSKLKGYYNNIKLYAQAEKIFFAIMDKVLWWLFQYEEVKEVKTGSRRIKGDVVRDKCYSIIDQQEDFEIEHDEHGHCALCGNGNHIKNGFYSEAHEASNKFILDELNQYGIDRNKFVIRIFDSNDGTLTFECVMRRLKVIYLYIDSIINNKVSRNKIPDTLYIGFPAILHSRLKNINKILNKLYDSFSP